MFKKLRTQLASLFTPGKTGTKYYSKKEVDEKLARLERNYLVLLKRVLQMDGVEFSSSSKKLSKKIMRTTPDARKHTIH